MRIGAPRETKEGERRVALMPAGIARLVREGHRVTIGRGLGAGVGIPDAGFASVGAEVGDAREAWAAELVVKVKEIQPADLEHMPRGAAFFGFQQLVGNPAMTRELAGRGATAIAFELVRDAAGRYPLLAPMSEIAGRMAVEAAAKLVPLAGEPALVLGAGNAGLAAAKVARAAGARVRVLTRSERSRDAARSQGFDAEVASPASIEREALAAALLVGAVLVPGSATPKLVPRALVRRMRRGAVIADVCVDGGGVAETSRMTTHAAPTFVDEGVIHYCVPNIPGAAPGEAAAALAQAALPYVSALAAKGIARACREDPALGGAILLWKGHVSHPAIAAESGLPYTVGLDLEAP